MKREQLIQAALDHISSARDILQPQLEASEATFESRSEKWQESEKGEELQSKIESLTDIINDLENAYDNLENLLQQ